MIDFFQRYYFTAWLPFGGSSSGQYFYAFETDTGAYEVVETSDGRRFEPASTVFSALGRVLVAGRAIDESGASAEGVELWELTSDGTVSLLFDLVPGSGSSFPAVISRGDEKGSEYAIDGFEGYHIVSVRRADETTEAYVISNGAAPAPLAGFVDGTDYIAGIENSVTIGNRTFLQSGFVQDPTEHAYVFDPTNKTFTRLSKFDRDVGTYNVSAIYNVDGRPFAMIRTDTYGWELWELGAGDIWTLVKDLAPGTSSSFPRYVRSFDGEHYFSARISGTSTFYRLDETEGLVELTIAGGDTGQKIGGGQTFEYDGELYFNIFNSVPIGEGLFRLGEDDTVIPVESFDIENPDEFPALFYNMPLQELDTLFGGTNRTEQYYVYDGTELSTITPPDDELINAVLRGGQLVMETYSNDQETQYWVRQEDGSFTRLPLESGVEIFALSLNSSFVDSLPAASFIPPQETNVEAAFSFGDDVIVTGWGDDRVFDNGGTNRIDLAEGDDVASVVSGANTVDGGTGDDLLIGGVGDDSLFGGDGVDVLVGDRTSQIFGNDLLDGGTGNDLLMGGNGADTFLFRPNEGSDRIGAVSVDYAEPSAAAQPHADFDPIVDRIMLDGFGYTSKANALDQVSSTREGALFSDQGTEIIFVGLDPDELTADVFVLA